MWFIRTVVVASLLIMLICGSESMPQQNTDLTIDLTDNQFLNALQSGFGNTATTTAGPLRQSNGQCSCVKLHECCDPLSQTTTSSSINGAPSLLGIVNPRIAGLGNSTNHIIDVSDRTNLACQDLLTVCCVNRCQPKIIDPPPVSNECGIRNPTGIDVTIQGFQDKQSQIGEFPWMVAVLDQATTYVGGGSLVHPKIILTAAHKVQGKEASTLVVRIGDWDLSNANERIQHQNINVERVVVHESFDRGTMVNNVALLILQSEATLSPTVNTICLPQSFQNFDNFDGSNCIVTGWGKDVFGETGRYQMIMKEVTVPAVKHNECQRLLRKTRLGPDFFLHNTFNCAGANGEDACEGDGGSPLVCPVPNKPNQYVQMGVVAWGIGCGIRGNPGVYGSIPQTVDWIKRTIQLEGKGSAGFDIRTVNV